MTVTVVFYLDSYLGLILILAWMYSTSELDELFLILNSIKGFKLDNHIGATQHGGSTKIVYRLRRIGQELGKTADEQLEYFKCSVPQHLYLYHKDTTTVKEAMENIKRTCALGGVPVVAPVDTKTTQSVPFMQMRDSQDSRNVPRNIDDAKISGFQFQGKIDYLDECMDKVVEILRLQNKKLLEENRIEEKGEIIEIVEVVETIVEKVIGVTQTQVLKMIDTGLEVEIVLEVDLEVEREQV